MDFVTHLWIPIVVSSVVVFFASSLAWMVLPHHKADIKFLPDEKTFGEELAKFNLAPGMYMWPGCASTEAMKSEEYKQRYASGPWGTLTIQGTQPSFGRNLVLVFVVYVVASVSVAYLTSQGRAYGASFASVFQMAGAVAVVAYCLGQIPGAIFMAKPCRFVCTDLLDGLVYGLIPGAIFAWLWPAAIAG